MEVIPSLGGKGFRRDTRIPKCFWERPFCFQMYTLQRNSFLGPKRLYKDTYWRAIEQLGEWISKI
jgi:hypothetical protein